MAHLTVTALEDLVVRILCSAGFSDGNAVALARQAVLAETLGQASVGVAHLSDYLEGLRAGRIDGRATPTLTEPAPTMILVEGHGGLPQSGFDLAFDDLVAKTKALGLCAFLQRGTTLCGSLSTFAWRLANSGLLCLAAANGSPLLAGSGSKEAVFCTNPMAFAAPQAEGPPLLIDQSSSATAFVNIRAAAERGEAIPEGWALDSQGRPTRDPKAALQGTLLAFGGARGANIALMVEVLAGGLTGANWSLDAPSFFSGDRSPGSGLFVLAINPALIDPDFGRRMAAQIKRLDGDHGVHIPGLSKARARRQAEDRGIEIDDALLANLRAMADQAKRKDDP